MKSKKDEDMFNDNEHVGIDTENSNNNSSYSNTNGCMDHLINSVLDDPNLMQSDLLSVLGTVQGRRLVRRMFRACGVFDYMPVGDAALYAWHEGRRSVGLVLYHQVFALGANFINQLLGEDKNNV